MPTRDAFASQLLALYRSEIREFLATNGAASVETLDQAAELLDGSLKQTGALKIGFIGEAQVGKSTLINALLDRLALPSGGIGPLTAQATRVEHGTENGLLAKYHTKGQLHKHAFAIARYLERRGDLKPGKEAAEPGVEKAPDEDDVVVEAVSVDSNVPETAGTKSDLGEYMLSQARRILCDANSAVSGAKVGDVALLDGMRAVIGQKPRGNAKEIEPLQPRISEVTALLGKQEELSESSFGGAKDFNRALKLRAAGWLSPLVSDLSLRLRADALEGLTLVDLPGIGVVGDAAGKVAEQFVRTEGDALVIVFRNSGLTEEVARLLEQTGVITKLLFGNRDEIAPIQVILAVTHLDDVARERHRQATLEAQEEERPEADRNELFRSLQEDMTRKLRDMLRDALRRSKSFEDLPEAQRRTRSAVIDSLCDQIHIACVAAPDYLNLALGYDSGSGFLRDKDATGIPSLRRHLAGLAREAGGRRARAIAQFERALRQGVHDHLLATANMYQEGRGVAVKEWERFRDGLIAAAEPLKQQMAGLHGEVMGVLRKAMQVEIQMMCKDAESTALKKLQRLSRDGRTRHYMTLKAALVRDGVYDKRDIHYPDALTLSLVDSIAADWEPKVVEKVRAEIRNLADRDLKLVEQLCETAKRLDPKIVSESPIEAQKRIMRSNSLTAVAWTREQLSELRASVQQKLRTVVSAPIEKACRKAVRAGAHYGTGAKNRILDTFEEGGAEAIEEARKEAERLLKEQYAALLRKLNEGFLKENHNPVQDALETLTNARVDSAKRSDAKRRRDVNALLVRFNNELDKSQGQEPLEGAA